ncbi:O(6)-methylguanine-induced apoptosis 2 [Notolabrus celidotus]|uniref:O(6)-methylguanine-induced apoptosis 2 n=1 Tax=Notolabrus celidotus TaxID=1203425 RepID=UPI0014905598|nr:O(6)-methylguanine-induced apoptosis 2 [Notolabrus celidotus]
MYREFNESDEIPAHTVSSSIPTKHQRMVKTNQEKKGFLSQSQRFPANASLRDNPGPDSYDCASNAETQSPSFSKKGTTGFVMSKASSHTGYLQRILPGPNAYNLQSSLIDTHDFNTGVSRVFRLPVAVKLDGPKHRSPAPNQYDIRFPDRERFSSVGGTSSFLSKTRCCEAFNRTENAPSPCHYQLNTSAIQNCSKAVSSPFRSKTQRIPAPVIKSGPGPGDYNPDQPPAPVKRTLLPRGHYLRLANPPLIIPKDPPFPGPGHYETDDYRGMSKHPVPTAAFVSRLERTPKYLKPNNNPAPGCYDPQILSKKSFNYSDPEVWVP